MPEELKDWDVSETITIRFSRDGKRAAFFSEQGKPPVIIERGNTEGTRPILDHIGATMGLLLWAEKETVGSAE